jgi:AraC family transcriptional regulator of adaptative response / DNA-3-methyladenine glycosylase II
MASFYSRPAYDLSMPKPSPTRSLTEPHADADAKYLALKTRDARFDGRFFTGVTSTGIYCRPVCKVRTPKRENCRFFTLAAQAESAGFRPCLRCRPELAPAIQADAPNNTWSVQDASHILARQAAGILDASAHKGEDYPDSQALASRLGVSERHLRRIFEAQWGVSPLQYVQTKRLLAAKQWLTDTCLPVTHIAALSGFGSLRRFNDAFVAHYRMQPTTLRKAMRDASAGKSGTHAPLAGLRLKASYRPPYDVDAMLGFLGKRCIPGVEMVDLQTRTYVRTLALRQAQTHLHGWFSARFLHSGASDPGVVEITVSESLANALPRVLARVRALLDLDADLQAINAVLGDSFAGNEGLRVPGTADGFELGVRAILGQQITVAAARTLTTRLVAQWGLDAATPFAELTKFFPGAQDLSTASAEALGQLGIVRQRQQALLGLAAAVAQGRIELHPGADVDATMQALQALPGIGPWTVNYIAMRALRWPDAFVAGDVALQKALGIPVASAATRAQAAERASTAWRPWRSYAVIRAWSQLG